MGLLSNLGLGNKGFGFARNILPLAVSSSPGPAMTQAQDGDYNIVTVNATCTLTFAGESQNMDFLVVGQGASGGNGRYWGGAGAGGIAYAATKPLSSGDYPVVVGSPQVTFNGIAANVGGQGSTTNGNPGGCGGGAGADGGFKNGGAQTQNIHNPGNAVDHGNSGGNCVGGYSRGGGGGAGSAGGNGSSGGIGGPGGTGVSYSITGSSITYGVGQGAKPGKGGHDTANPNADGRGGGGSCPGGVVIKYKNQNF